MVAIGDTPYDAEAAGKAGIPAIGVPCGGFTEADLRKAGCVAVHPGPAALLACLAASPLMTDTLPQPDKARDGIANYNRSTAIQI